MSKVGPVSRYVGEIVRQERRARDWTQTFLAERMVTAGEPSWSRATVSEVERGNRNVTVDELVSLRKLFDGTEKLT